MLLEFALVSFALYLLIAAVIGLGRWMATVQSVQDAARIAAREIALYPLPAEFVDSNGILRRFGFADAIADPDFRRAVYSPDFLVIDLAVNPPGPSLNNFLAAMPVVNQALQPLMITSTVDVGGARRRLLHVPGLITDSATSPSGLTVRVPRVDARDASTGAETAITLVDVIEEISPGAFRVPNPDPTDPDVGGLGLVAIRLNVPYQSATLSAYLPTADLTPEGYPFNQPVVASDPQGGGYRIVGPGPDGSGPYSGTYGLGEHLALRERVRPFRRLISTQAIFRREVFL